MCNLYDHLTLQRKLAEARQEKAEVKRLDGEIAKHKDRCVLCAGAAVPALVRQFFGDLPVKLLEEQPQ